MTQAESQAAGVAANNKEADDPAGLRLSWLYKRAIPTGDFFEVPFSIPASAALYKLDFILPYWPVTNNIFRPLYIQLSHDGEKFFFIDHQKPMTSKGADLRLFTSPTVNTDPSVNGDQAAPLGAFPINLEFPGRAELLIGVRGATAAPNPAYIDLLICGHRRNRLVSQ